MKKALTAVLVTLGVVGSLFLPKAFAAGACCAGNAPCCPNSECCK